MLAVIGILLPAQVQNRVVEADVSADSVGSNSPTCRFGHAVRLGAVSRPIPEVALSTRVARLEIFMTECSRRLFCLGKQFAISLCLLKVAAEFSDHRSMAREYTHGQ